MLLIDAPAKMILNKHFDKVIEIKGDYAAWDSFAPALYLLTLLLINVVQYKQILSLKKKNMLFNTDPVLERDKHKLFLCH